MHLSNPNRTKENSFLTKKPRRLAVYPVEYGYDPVYGRRTSMTTYRDDAGFSGEWESDGVKNHQIKPLGRKVRCHGFGQGLPAALFWESRFESKHIGRSPSPLVKITPKKR
jgi:hypothetical protein